MCNSADADRINQEKLLGREAALQLLKGLVGWKRQRGLLQIKGILSEIKEDPRLMTFYQGFLDAIRESEWNDTT